MNFNDFKGSRAVIENLEKLAASHRLPHAILIDGGTAEQRLSLAGILAQALVCGGDNPPCGVCSNCRKAESGNHGDIITVAGGETLGSFKIDTVRREVRDTAYIMPNEARCKVYILHNTQSMMAPAQNAILKILEEPPESVVFILTCDSKTKMLETIRSRVTVFTLDAEIDSAKTEKASETSAQLAEALMKADEFALLSATGVLEKDKELLAGTINALHTLFRDAVILYGGGETLLSGREETARCLMQSFTAAQLLECFKVTEEFEESLKLNPNQNLLITRLCSKLREAIGR